MSPRRKIDPGVGAALVLPKLKRDIHWGFAVLTGLAAVVIVAAITVSSLMLVAHESERRTTIRDVAVLDYVRSFMTQYTSPDPFHANDYADRVLAQATGEFAKSFRDRMNEITIQVAMAQPATGSVLEAGVEKWNDDGSANVLVATKISTTSADGKKPVEVGGRWVATAIKEGQQWKISQLMQVA